MQQEKQEKKNFFNKLGIFYFLRNFNSFPNMFSRIILILFFIKIFIEIDAVISSTLISHKDDQINLDSVNYFDHNEISKNILIGSFIGGKIYNLLKGNLIKKNFF